MTYSEEKKSGVVCFEEVNQIGILTIDNGSQNKIPQPDFLDLSFLKEWISEQRLKGLIITGKGRHFSAGADVDNIRANKDNPGYLREALKKGRDILNYIESLPIITVAAISGICFGAGLEIALSCQFRIGTANALLAFPESNIGIMPGLTGTIRLSRIVGKSKALEIIITGRTINGEESYSLGLVDKIVPNKTHLSAAVQFINELTKNKSHQQIRSIIQSVNKSAVEKDAIAMEYESEMFLKLVENI
ncbi:MAG: fadJ [Clostridia bacterium]|jgi:enoyl-CoA hydratase|uniref:enoyl-CoA hydratase/isomerase family protein n=1 Tax=Petroclostridium xylanilyticum TaxID=1792311 RepID=UPI000B9963CB|nr:enoyl-CoA hydratase/isomerase family protein [Petroclostridium xylanilyticum]MBZ4646521.1 fadJ [Clostridia bacterium]